MGPCFMRILALILDIQFDAPSNYLQSTPDNTYPIGVNWGVRIIGGMYYWIVSYLIFWWLWAKSIFWTRTCYWVYVLSGVDCTNLRIFLLWKIKTLGREKNSKIVWTPVKSRVSEKRTNSSTCSSSKHVQWGFSTNPVFSSSLKAIFMVRDFGMLFDI
jgi:hypothetical protein